MCAPFTYGSGHDSEEPSQPAAVLTLGYVLCAALFFHLGLANLEERSCVVEGLRCASAYEFAVQALCEDEDANSAMGNTSQATMTQWSVRSLCRVPAAATPRTYHHGDRAPAPRGRSAGDRRQDEHRLMRQL